MTVFKWLAAAACAAMTGCAFFPQDIRPPESVFADPELGKRGSPLTTVDIGAAAKEMQAAAKRSAEAQRNVLQEKDPTARTEAATIAEETAAQAHAKTIEFLSKANQQEPAGGTVSGSSQTSSSIGRLDADLERKLVAAWIAMEVANGSNSTAYADVLQLGIQVMDRRCGRYFTALGTAAQRTSFANKELGLTTGLVAALQGLTGVAADDIAMTAALLGFLGASSNAYSEVFIFSPDVGSVETLVLNGQQAIKDRIKTMAPTEFSKPVVVGLLQTYEKSCEVKTIRRLVNESLTTARPVATFSGDVPATARAAVAAALGVPALTDEQLAAVYWLAYKAPPDASEKAKLESVLSGVSSLVDDKGKLRDVSRLQPTLRIALGPLLAAGTSQLDTQVEQLRKGDKAKGSGDIAAGGTQRLFAPAMTLSIPVVPR